ncbi:cytochrome P450 2A13-like [Ctenodactylus gundi]
MMASGLLLLALLACLTVMMLKSVWQQRKPRGKLPPGPTPLPFIGNYLQLDTNQMCDSLMKISEHYGPVFTIHLGMRRIVVLCGYDAVKEALVDQAEEFSGRGDHAIWNRIYRGYGLISSGNRAKELRRFTITTLKDFGMGRRDMEERILEEAGYLLEALKGCHGTSIRPITYLRRAVFNVSSSIVFGERYNYEDKDVLSLMFKILEVTYFTGSSVGQLYEMFPSVMKHLPGPQQQVLKNLQWLKNFIAKRVEQNQQALDPTSPKDFIDVSLIRIQEEKNNPNTEYNMKNLMMLQLGLLFGGTETVTSNLCCGFMMLMKHPDVEAKVHEEIDSVIGRTRQPHFEDRVKMPYVEAVIHEILRCANLNSTGFVHGVTKDTRFREFLLPKGTEVFPVLGSVLKEPKFFSKPLDFYPQHFLDEKGQFKKSEAFVPFSMGKRKCLGENLARMELFLFFTTIMQNFRIKPSQLPQNTKMFSQNPEFNWIQQIDLLPR